MRYRYNLQEPEPEPPPKDRSGSGSSQKHSINQCCGQCCRSGRLLTGSVSGSGSDFEVRFRIWIRIFSEFLLFFIFLLFYSKFRFGSVVYSRIWIRNRRPWFRSLAKSICTVYRYLMLQEMVYSQSESGGSTVTTPTSRYADSSCYFCSCKEYR